MTIMPFNDMSRNSMDMYGSETDAVFPVILVGETSARPAQDGNAKPLQGGKDIDADSVCVRNGRIFANPKSFVNASSQVFGEVSVNVAVDLATLFVIRLAIGAIWKKPTKKPPGNTGRSQLSLYRIVDLTEAASNARASRSTPTTVFSRSVWVKFSRSVFFCGSAAKKEDPGTKATPS